MDLDNFDDQPKKKKPKKSKKKKKPPPVYTKIQYETKVARLNGKLAELRTRHIQKAEEARKLNQELRQIEEDRTGVNEHLERAIVKQKAYTTELSERIIVIQEEHKNYNLVSQERITELQKDYASEHNRLQNEIKLLQTAVHSLDEFRLLRDGELERYETYKKHTKELERKMKQDVFNLEQKAVVEKNVLKKEIELKLEQVAADFLHSNETRNASYTRNLIRENITLKQALDKRVKLNIHTMEEREKQFLKTKEVMEAYMSLEQFVNHLARTIQNKNDIIDHLKANIESLRLKHIDACHYRTLYDEAMECGLFSKKCEDFDGVHRHFEQMAKEKRDILLQHHNQETEIQRLREILGKLMNTFNVAIRALKELPLSQHSEGQHTDDYDGEGEVKDKDKDEYENEDDGDGGGADDDDDHDDDHDDDDHDDDDPDDDGHDDDDDYDDDDEEHDDDDDDHDDEDDNDRKEFYRYIRKNIITELIRIITNNAEMEENNEDDEEIKFNSIYQPGKCGFIIPRCMINEEHTNLLCLNSNMSLKSRLTLPPSIKSKMQIISANKFDNMKLESTSTNLNSFAWPNIEDCSSNYDEEHDEELKDTNRGQKVSERIVRFHAPIPNDFVTTAKIVASCPKKPERFEFGEETSSFPGLSEEI